MSRPLDQAEAAFYGRFIDAAYSMFLRDPAQLKPVPVPGEIPDPYELVAWINMNDFGIFSTEPKFYGLLARHQQNRHQFVLAIRGTEGAMEWWDDAVTRLVPFAQVPHAGRVEKGFDRIYSSLKVIKVPRADEGANRAMTAAQPASVEGSFAEQLQHLADSLEDADMRMAIRAEPQRRPPRSFVVTGHSLGSALATLFGIENKEKNTFDVSTICTFASPRVGDSEFVRQFNLLPVTSWRLVNTQDLVPKVPLRIPWFFDYHHVDTLYEFSSKGVVKWNPACWHSMKTYLHWLDPAVAVDPNCKAGS